MRSREKVKSVAFLIVGIILLSTESSTESYAQSNETKKGHSFSLETSIEMLRFEADSTVTEYDNIKDLDHDFSGRQRKVEHNPSFLEFIILKASYRYKNHFRLIGSYGSHRPFYDSGEDVVQNRVRSPKLLQEVHSERYGLGLEVDNFLFEYKNQTLSDGELKLIDVSGDAEGENGDVVGHYLYVSKFEEYRFSHTGMGNLGLPYLVQLTPFLFYERGRYPSIPFTLEVSEDGSGISYVGEGELQNIQVHHLLLGLSAEWKWFDTSLAFGRTEYRFRDHNQEKRRIARTSGRLKLGGHYDLTFKVAGGEWCLRPYAQHILTFFTPKERDDDSAKAESVHEVQGAPMLTTLGVSLKFTY